MNEIMRECSASPPPPAGALSRGAFARKLTSLRTVRIERQTRVAAETRKEPSGGRSADQRAEHCPGRRSIHCDYYYFSELQSKRIPRRTESKSWATETPNGGHREAGEIAIEREK